MSHREIRSGLLHACRVELCCASALCWHLRHLRTVDVHGMFQRQASNAHHAPQPGLLQVSPFHAQSELCQSLLWHRNNQNSGVEIHLRYSLIHTHTNNMHSSIMGRVILNHRASTVHYANNCILSHHTSISGAKHSGSHIHVYQGTNR